MQEIYFVMPEADIIGTWG